MIEICSQHQLGFWQREMSGKGLWRDVDERENAETCANTCARF